MLETLSKPGTKDRILDTAERLFAQNGFDSTSLRAITAEAGVNLAAVNYHFQSKDALIRAVIGRRMAPINEARMRLLEQYEAEAAGAPVALERLLDAFLRPMLDANLSGAVEFGRVLARIYTEPEEYVKTIFREHLDQIFRRFQEAFERALPYLPETELMWRLHFMVGSMLHTVGAAAILVAISNGRCDPSDVDGVLKRMTVFLSAGLRAPAAG